MQIDMCIHMYVEMCRDLYVDICIGALDLLVTRDEQGVLFVADLFFEHVH